MQLQHCSLFHRSLECLSSPRQRDTFVGGKLEREEMHTKGMITFFSTRVPFSHSPFLSSSVWPSWVLTQLRPGEKSFNRWLQTKAADLCKLFSVSSHTGPLREGVWSPARAEWKLDMLVCFDPCLHGKRWGNLAYFSLRKIWWTLTNSS